MCDKYLFILLIFAILSQNSNILFKYFIDTMTTSDDVNCPFSIIFTFFLYFTHKPLPHCTKGINNNHFNGINDFTFRLIKLFDFSKQSSIKFITRKHSHTNTHTHTNLNTEKKPSLASMYLCMYVRNTENWSHKVNINEYKKKSGKNL